MTCPKIVRSRYTCANRHVPWCRRGRATVLAMSERPIELVVTDLDGTLWDRDQQIHPATMAAIGELDRRGVAFLIATGRRVASARVGFAQNNLWRPSILLNGGLGIDFTAPNPTGSLQPFHQATFQPDIALKTWEVFADHDRAPVVYGVDGTVFVPPNASTGPNHLAGLHKVGDAVFDVDPIPSLQAGDAVALGVIGVEGGDLDPLAEALSQLGLIVDRYRDPVYGATSVLAQAPGVSKLTGIEAWMAHAGRPGLAFLAVGDGGNDVEMLRGATLAVGIDGGDDSALAVSDHVIGGPDAGGWAEILNIIERY